jgi:hypothetical protein
MKRIFPSKMLRESGEENIKNNTSCRLSAFINQRRRGGRSADGNLMVLHIHKTAL